MKKIWAKIQTKIQTKITLIIFGVVIITSLVSNVTSAFITRNSTMTATKKSLKETVEVSAIAAKNMLDTYTYTIGEIATSSVLTNPKSTIEEKLAFLDTKTESYYMRSSGLADINGIDVKTGKSVKNEEFFKSALNGAAYMSTPYVSEDKKDAYIVVSAPVFQNEQVSSVVYFLCDINILQSVIESVTVGEGGYSYILDKNGTMIAGTDVKAVYGQQNLIKDESIRSKENRELAEIQKKMIAGEEGAAQFHSGKEVFLQNYVPIEGTDGWSVAVAISENEFMQSASRGNRIQLILGFGFIVIALILGKKIGTSIGNPIVLCAKRLELLAKGDLKSEAPVVNTKDEVKILSDSTKILINSFNDMICDISQVLGGIAEGNLNVESDIRRYAGDFESLWTFTGTISDKLNTTIGGITESAVQVSGSAELVAATGTALSAGTAEQAEAIEKLSFSITELEKLIRETVSGAESASNMSREAKEKLIESTERMNELVDAMAEIDKKSVEISKILKVIDDIAFQTNILALNAAVEAARAGEAGKGFAVVADEVRSLANKSAEAAKTTAMLIEQSALAAQNGTKLVSVASSMIGEVKESSEQSETYVYKIAKQAKEQAHEISEINNRVEVISGVIRTNSATSEESASTSQQLSEQAGIMKELVSKFKLKKKV